MPRNKSRRRTRHSNHSQTTQVKLATTSSLINELEKYIKSHIMPIKLLSLKEVKELRELVKKLQKTITPSDQNFINYCNQLFLVISYIQEIDYQYRLSNDKDSLKQNLLSRNPNAIAAAKHRTYNILYKQWLVHLEIFDIVREYLDDKIEKPKNKTDKQYMDKLVIYINVLNIKLEFNYKNNKLNNTISIIHELIDIARNNNLPGNILKTCILGSFLYILKQDYWPNDRSQSEIALHSCATIKILKEFLEKPIQHDQNKVLAVHIIYLMNGEQRTAALYNFLDAIFFYISVSQYDKANEHLTKIDSVITIIRFLANKNQDIKQTNRVIDLLKELKIGLDKITKSYLDSNRKSSLTVSNGQTQEKNNALLLLLGNHDPKILPEIRLEPLNTLVTIYSHQKIPNSTIINKLLIKHLNYYFENFDLIIKEEQKDQFYDLIESCTILHAKLFSNITENTDVNALTELYSLILLCHKKLLKTLGEEPQKNREKLVQLAISSIRHKEATGFTPEIFDTLSLVIPHLENKAELLDIEKYIIATINSINNIESPKNIPTLIIHNAKQFIEATKVIRAFIEKAKQLGFVNSLMMSNNYKPTIKLNDIIFEGLTYLLTCTHNQSAAIIFSENAKMIFAILSENEPGVRSLAIPYQKLYEHLYKTLNYKKSHDLEIILTESKRMYTLIWRGITNTTEADINKELKLLSSAFKKTKLIIESLLIIYNINQNKIILTTVQNMVKISLEHIQKIHAQLQDKTKTESNDEIISSLQRKKAKLHTYGQNYAAALRLIEDGLECSQNNDEKHFWMLRITSLIYSLYITSNHAKEHVFSILKLVVKYAFAVFYLKEKNTFVSDYSPMIEKLINDFVFNLVRSIRDKKPFSIKKFPKSQLMNTLKKLGASAVFINLIEIIYKNQSKTPDELKSSMEKFQKKIMLQLPLRSQSSHEIENDLSLIQRANPVARIAINKLKFHMASFSLEPITELSQLADRLQTLNQQLTFSKSVSNNHINFVIFLFDFSHYFIEHPNNAINTTQLNTIRYFTVELVSKVQAYLSTTLQEIIPLQLTLLTNWLMQEIQSNSSINLFYIVTKLHYCLAQQTPELQKEWFSKNKKSLTQLKKIFRSSNSESLKISLSTPLLTFFAKIGEMAPKRDKPLSGSMPHRNEEGLEIIAYFKKQLYFYLLSNNLEAAYDLLPSQKELNAFINLAKIDCEYQNNLYIELNYLSEATCSLLTKSNQQPEVHRSNLLLQLHRTSKQSDTQTNLAKGFGLILEKRLALANSLAKLNHIILSHLKHKNKPTFDAIQDTVYTLINLNEIPRKMFDNSLPQYFTFLLNLQSLTKKYGKCLEITSLSQQVSINIKSISFQCKEYISKQIEKYNKLTNIITFHSEASRQQKQKCENLLKTSLAPYVEFLINHAIKAVEICQFKSSEVLLQSLIELHDAAKLMSHPCYIHNKNSSDNQAPTTLMKFFSTLNNKLLSHQKEDKIYNMSHGWHCLRFAMLFLELRKQHQDLKLGSEQLEHLRKTILALSKKGTCSPAMISTVRTLLTELNQAVTPDNVDNQIVKLKNTPSKTS